jgi:histidine triad (HIT) family protein
MPEIDPGCVFCRIAQREIVSHVVYEDHLVVAFLDRSPIRPGHTQIIPKRHYDYFDDLPLHTATRIVEVGQKLAKVMKGIYRVPRVAFVFTGGDITHAHAHAVPLHEGTDITSRRYIVENQLTFRPLPRASQEALREEAQRLAAGLQLPPMAAESDGGPSEASS